MNLPEGLCALDEHGVYWYVKGGKRIRCFTKRTASSWNFNPVRVSLASIEHIEYTGSTLGFRDGSVVENFSDGTIWLISNNKRRLLVDPDAFKLLGIQWKNVILASSKEVELHDIGEPIECPSITQ